MSWWVCSLQEGPNCSSLATGELLLHYLKVSAPLVEVLVSAVFGKRSLAAEKCCCAGGAGSSPVVHRQALLHSCLVSKEVGGLVGTGENQAKSIQPSDCFDV
ncbi:uncharacterized protein [Salvelinus alpinus]|uniref:uncharacterized protein isoform X4 n=1 Tax=Salvelinus alpinus TaxID=8036 RepID=UPI0039FBDAFF